MKSARAMRRERVKYNAYRRRYTETVHKTILYPRWDVLHPRPLLVQLGKHAWEVLFA